MIDRIKIKLQATANKAQYILKLKKTKGTLVYVGMHRGANFSAIFRKYERCYGFEANPKMFNLLKKRFGRFKRVQIYNAAAGKKNGEIDFHISSNDGLSSSVGEFDENWDVYKAGKARMVEKIRTPSINLYDFFKSEAIDYIDDYVSDIQGLDLEVLKTLKPFIDAKKIGTITCEVAKNERGNVYKNLRDNSEAGFEKLLGANYECVAKGWGLLRDGDFSGTPHDWWEMDCKWVVKK